MFAQGTVRIVCGSLALVMAVLGCGSREEPSLPAVTASPKTTLKAAVEEVRTAQFPVVVEVTGQVTAASQATLSSKVQGTVQEIRVREGSAVSKGETLVVLDSRDLRANLARAEAEVENARAQLARMKRLYQQESVAKQELDNATRSFKVAQAGKQAAEAQLSYTVIKAPFDGVITEKNVEVGELAAPGQPTLKMEDSRYLRLEATVAEGDLKALSVGGKTPVLIDALGGSLLTGTIVQILPSGDPSTHTFLVKVDLPPTPGLKSGMFGRMKLDKGVSQTLVVPRSAMRQHGELTGVFVVGQDSIARLRWVKVGRELGDSLEVLSGLNVGERVLSDGTKGVDEARVQIVETMAAPAPR